MQEPKAREQHSATSTRMGLTLGSGETQEVGRKKHKHTRSSMSWHCTISPPPSFVYTFESMTYLDVYTLSTSKGCKIPVESGDRLHAKHVEF